MSRTISNSDDVIDSRDVIARIEELEDERDNWPADDSATDAQRGAAWATDNPEDAAELAALRALDEEASGYAADWKHGECLIRDSYFETYAQETAEDCGMIEHADKWPGRCIDWTEAARQLQEDYTSVEYDGVTYWIR